MLNIAILTIKHIQVYELHATGPYSQHCLKKKMHYVLTLSKIFWLVIQNFQNFFSVWQIVD